MKTKNVAMIGVYWVFAILPPLSLKYAIYHKV